jgi:hypothetical protein
VLFVGPRRLKSRQQHGEECIPLRRDKTALPQRLLRDLRAIETLASAEAIHWALRVRLTQRVTEQCGPPNSQHGLINKINFYY